MALATTDQNDIAGVYGEFSLNTVCSLSLTETVVIRVTESQLSAADRVHVSCKCFATLSIKPPS